MTANDDLAYRLTYEVRTLFNRMTEVVDHLHEDSGITTATRAVMECLAGGKEKSVPQMARERSVSRQHIQILTNTLAEKALVGMKSNPDHKRSPLIHLTNDGEELFRAMRLKERNVLEAMGGLASERDLKKTIDTLQTLNSYFDTVMTGLTHETA